MSMESAKSANDSEGQEGGEPLPVVVPTEEEEEEEEDTSVSQCHECSSLSESGSEQELVKMIQEADSRTSCTDNLPG